MIKQACGLAAAVLLGISSSQALQRTDTEFKIFQFPANMIPRIDGQAGDWAMVPDSYAYGTDQLSD
ncbi:MAG: PKD domain containing protein, partial [Gemmatimonadota bacterium]|nr:PKD domain containing protein [Gemmatimonadota bacterium]